MPESPRLSILIVNWNTRELLLGCLQSVQDHAPPFPYEVIVVDNDSRDGSAAAVRARFPWVHVREAGANLGFAKGNNVALEHARGELVLLLNPDTLVLPGTIANAVARFAADPRIGLLGIKQLEGDGRVQPSCGNPPSLRTLVVNAVGGGLVRLGRPGLARRLFARAGLAWVPVRALSAHWDAEAESDVGWIMGSFLLMTRALAREMGPFDERFSMYGEDMDLGKRVRAQGKRVLYYPGATIVHFGGASTKRIAAEADAAHFLATIRFYEKHNGPVATVVYRAILFGGSLLMGLLRMRQPDAVRAARLRARVALAPRSWRWPPDGK